MIQTYNVMLIERWIIKAPQKIIPPLRNSESKAPQKILMIRFETKTWLMENQVKLSCFSPVSVHLEIWLQLFWRLLDQNQSRFDSEAAAEAERLHVFRVEVCWLLRALTHFLLQVVGLKHSLVDERLFSRVVWDQTGALRLKRALETKNTSVTHQSGICSVWIYYFITKIY